jgi:ATP-binding cassette subfamily B protein
MLQALVAIAISVGIVTALILIDPMVALAAGVLFSLIYVLISSLVRARLKRGGGRIAAAQTTRIQMLQEGLGSIRDIIVDGREFDTLHRFATLERSLLRAQAEAQIISSAPRYLVETTGIVILVLLAVILTGQSDPGAALPTIGALALAAQRLLPQAQQLYGGWASITGNRRIVEDVLKFQALPKRDLLRQHPISNDPGFHRTLRFEGVAFAYPGGATPVLQGIDLSIPRGSRVGVVGETGAGKSTLVDLILGLLQPTEGRILIDDTVLGPINRRAWQDHLAHVPQTLFLADASIAENIALGVPMQEIDLERVRRAASLAMLDRFIRDRPDGLWSRVGERGGTISGGQRQRIGIARALYHAPAVLVLDEATNALDAATEQAVIENLIRERPEITVFMVTHRMESLRDCDLFIRVENGTARVADSPGFDTAAVCFSDDPMQRRPFE